jgi:hypothetical protein
MIPQDIKIKLNKGTNVLIKVAAIGAAVISLGAAYSFFLSYIYKPKIEVAEVDFTLGKARIRVLGLFPNVFEINGETIHFIAGEWGVRFGSINIGGTIKYNRIELVRNNMVVQYLYKPNL